MLLLIMQKIYGIQDLWHEVHGQTVVFTQILTQQNLIQVTRHQPLQQYMEIKRGVLLFMPMKKVQMILVLL